jgi:hypothetical protein
VGGGSSSASGSSGFVFPLGDHTALIPFCSVLGGPVHVTISANAEPVPVAVVSDITSTGAELTAWATGSSPVPAGGGTIVSEPLDPGTCGQFVLGLRLGNGCMIGSPCDPPDFSFRYRVTW